MDGWMDGWTDGWMDGKVKQFVMTVCHWKQCILYSKSLETVCYDCLSLKTVHTLFKITWDFVQVLRNMWHVTE